MESKLQVVHSTIAGSKEFYELDKQITDLIRDFVQLGEKLVQMRDGQHYRTAGYASFEDYCKGKAGLSMREAHRTIRQSMAYRAITKIWGGNIAPPETKAQIDSLLPMANFNMEEREYAKADGTVTHVKQPVGIRNESAVAKQWEKTVKEFERRQAKAEKEGTRPPTLSGKFVRNMLPNELKVSPDRGFHVNPLVQLCIRIQKLHMWMEQNGCTKQRRLKKLADTEPPCHPAQVNDLVYQTEKAVEMMTEMMELLEPYMEEEGE
jgi:hypothetical protein